MPSYLKVESLQMYNLLSEKRGTLHEELLIDFKKSLILISKGLAKEKKELKKKADQFEKRIEKSRKELGYD